jgi:hypothetical protein
MLKLPLLVQLLGAPTLVVAKLLVGSNIARPSTELNPIARRKILFMSRFPLLLEFQRV